MPKLVLKAKTPADLLDKIRKEEGWPRVEGDSLITVQKAREKYNLTKTHNAYVAHRIYGRPA